MCRAGLSARPSGCPSWGTALRTRAASDVLPPGCVFGSPNESASVLSMPDALAQPWRARRASVPQGFLERVEIGSGTTASVVHVYRAPGTETATDVPLAILFDGGTLLDIDIAATFDNLVHEQAIEPLVAVLVESIRGSARRGPTRVESLTAPGMFESFVIEELIPVLVARLPITDDPSRSAVVGQSLGGLAALWLAHRHPRRFGCAVAQSSSMWWPGGDGQLSGDDVLAAYAGSVPPVRLFVEAGSEEREVPVRQSPAARASPRPRRVRRLSRVPRRTRLCVLARWDRRRSDGHVRNRTLGADSPTAKL